MDKKVINKLKMITSKNPSVGVEVYNDAIVVRSMKADLVTLHKVYRQVYELVAPYGKFKYFIPVMSGPVPKLKINNLDLEVKDSKHSSSNLGTRFVLASDLLNHLFIKMGCTEKVLMTMINNDIIPKTEEGIINMLGAISDTFEDKNRELFLLQGKGSMYFAELVNHLTPLVLNLSKASTAKKTDKKEVQYFKA